MSENWYAVLDVESSATEDDIKKAYRKKALLYHPDRNPDNPSADAMFKKATQAYSVLRDTEKRRAFDRTRSAANFFSQNFNAPSASDVLNDINDIIDGTLSDKLDKFFGRSPAPKDIEVKLHVTLDELYEGADKTVTFKRDERCGSCQGRGAIKKEDFRICDTCLGIGFPPKLSNLWKRGKRKCGKCRGSGKLIAKPCKGCKGAGLAKKEVQLVIPLPKDLAVRDTLIVPEEGEGGGNLLIQVQAKKHPTYAVDGAHLITEVPLSFCQAVLGDLVEIPTLKGPAWFKVEPGTQPGDEIVLEGYGLRNGKESFGNLRIKVCIAIPKKTNKTQRELLEAYKKSSPVKKVKPRRA
jgi:molecular chaperone DnaJ